MAAARLGSYGSAGRGGGAVAWQRRARSSAGPAAVAPGWVTRAARAAQQPLPPGTQRDRPAGKASLPEGQQHKQRTKRRRPESWLTPRWAPGLPVPKARPEPAAQAVTQKAGVPREPCSVRGRGQALFGGQQRQQEDAKEGTGRGPCAPGPRSFMTTHRGWQGQTSDESPQPTGRNGRNWGDPTRRDSQENTRREECLFPKRGSPPGRSRHTRAVKSHLQPSGELGQEQTSASSFRTPTNTEHAHDDRKQILSSGL